MPDAVLEAFCAAARECVPLDQLQAAASRVIAEATGAEAGLVTAGAAAALTLGTAAILTGYDLGRMEPAALRRVPSRVRRGARTAQRYDHAVRAGHV
jgi:L-seryl-tRNA(Ser) seleniumtransferase